MTWHDTRLVTYWTIAGAVLTSMCICIGIVIMTMGIGRYKGLLPFAAAIHFVTVLLPMVATVIALRYSSRRVAILAYIATWPILGLPVCFVLFWVIHFENSPTLWEALVHMVIAFAPSVAALATLVWMTRQSKDLIPEELDSRDQP